MGSHVNIRTQKVRDKSKQLLSKAIENEPQVTSDLESAVNQGTGELQGLEYKIKSENSLTRKLNDLANSLGLTIEEFEVSDNFEHATKDVLRYTNVSSPDNLVNDYFKVKDYLESRGYEYVMVFNSLGNENAPYRGINLTIKSPKGYKFELQFHTHQSLQIKETNHTYYEEQRLASTSKARKLELDKLMRDNARRVQSPRDINKIVNKW